MGGFVQALSALAPIAPALADAKQLNTERAQQQEQFAQDAQLREAQLTASRLASEAEQQRITQANQPQFIGEPQWNPLTMTTQGVTLDPNTGQLTLKDVPGGVDPTRRAQAIISEREQTTGQKLTPEEKENIYDQVSGLHPLTSNKVTQLTGDAGKPYQGNDKQWYVNARDASGAIIAMPLGPNYNPPAPKPATSPVAQYTNLLAKQILANQKKGPPLTPEELAQLQAAQSAMTLPGVTRAQAWAQAAAANNLIAITDPVTGMDTLVTRAQAAQMANSGAPPLAGVVSSPTGLDKKNQPLAQSAIQQVNRMEAILARDPSLTGPGAGQLTALQTWLGTQDPDAQAFLMSSLLGSEHGVAVFGGRNIHTIQDLQQTLGAWKTNPAALKAALEVIRETMAPWATGGGRLLGPRTGGSAPSSSNPTTPTKQHSLRTAMSLPFNKGKTAAQVKADLEAHGYSVIP
jgi:hypothetical protein